MTALKSLLMNFSEVTVIVRKGDEREIAKLNDLYDLKIGLDIVTANTADDPGTAESLHAIETKIKVKLCNVI